MALRLHWSRNIERRRKQARLINKFTGKILSYKNWFSAKRYLDKFDYVHFLNTGEIPSNCRC